MYLFAVQDELIGLKLPRGRKTGVRSIAAERSGPDAAGEESGQCRIMLGDSFYGYLDGTGYVDACPL